MQTLWSVKGGAGVTVTAAALAAGWARRGRSALLVDLCGDAPAVFGMADPTGPGVRDWLDTPDGSAEALDRLTLPVADGLALLPCGEPVGQPTPARIESLATALRRHGAAVVVDGGRRHCPSIGAPQDRLVDALAGVGHSFLVTRPCYLSLRRAVAHAVRADGVVLVEEPGRSLGRRDIADVLGIPVLASIESDPAVARSVDAGLLVRRPNRMLERSLRDFW